MHMGGDYDLVIVGAGVTGTSIFHLLNKYTDIDKVLLVEKYDKIAPLNSNSRANSQTLHFGDIETHYTLEKAKITNVAARMLLNYTDNLDKDVKNKIIQHCPKMVLAVGKDEIEELENVYNSGIKEIFPTLKMGGRDEIGKTEPGVVKGRPEDEKIEAIISEDGYMVNFGALANSFVENSKQRDFSVKLNTEVKKVKKHGDKFVVSTPGGEINAKMVVFASGTYSLMFARSMGYARNLLTMSVGGGFYYSPRVLNGKVYRVQMGDIPFAAVHGDPDINYPDRNRFGPTVDIAPLLEKGKLSTFWTYLEHFDFDIKTFESFYKLLGHKDIQNILFRNFLYMFPFGGKHEFMKKEVKKIVPSLNENEIKPDKSAGGIRPQVIDKDKRKLMLGESMIKEERLIFDITPSPGASSCLNNALENVTFIKEQLGLKMDSDALLKDLPSASSRLD